MVRLFPFSPALMVNEVAMDIRSPMLQPDEQWTRHSPLLCELTSLMADEAV